MNKQQILDKIRLKQQQGQLIIDADPNYPAASEEAIKAVIDCVFELLGVDAQAEIVVIKPTEYKE